MAHAVQQPIILTSWKEIANYLGKGVRTVQRWEVEFDLPVRRPDARSKGIVHANTAELDEWLARRWTRRNGGGNGNAVLMLNSPHVAKSKNFPHPELLKQVERSRELRERHRELLEELTTTMETLQRHCQNMTTLLQLGMDPPARV